MRSSARWFAAAVLLFGVVAVAVGSLGSLAGFLAWTVASGCDGMVRQLLGIAAAALALIGVPHVLVPLLYLRGHRHGRAALRGLCTLNLLVNAALVILVASQVELVAGVPWVGLFLANVLGLAILARDSRP